MKAHEIEGALEKLRRHADDKSAREFRKVVDDVDGRLDYFADEPDAYECFYIGCFSDVGILKSKHLLEVALKFSGFSSEISKAFYDNLFGLFLKNYLKFSDDLFCLEMATFFAYNYHCYEETKENFMKLFELEKSGVDRKHGIANSGLDYLAKEKARRS
jgi:hypothetical protein